MADLSFDEWLRQNMAQGLYRSVGGAGSEQARILAEQNAGLGAGADSATLAALSPSYDVWSKGLGVLGKAASAYTAMAPFLQQPSGPQAPAPEFHRAPQQPWQSNAELLARHPTNDPLFPERRRKRSTLGLISDYYE
jgi:hypothetical protein